MKRTLTIVIAGLAIVLLLATTAQAEVVADADATASQAGPSAQQITIQKEKPPQIKFDPEEATWDPLPDMQVPVLAAAVSNVGDIAVITGGIPQLGTTSPLVQLFNMRTEKWLPSIRMHTGRALHTQVTMKDGLIFVVGGQTGTVKPIGKGLVPTGACEMIDIKARKSIKLNPLPEAIAEPTAHLMPDGKLVVIGGGFARRYNPTLKSWLRSISLRESRQAHTSVVLKDGRIVVIGGVWRDTIEVIDFNTRISRALAVKLPDPVDDTAALQLPDGRIWILGGQYSRKGNTTDQTWLLDVNGKKSKLTDGPRLGILKGVADARVVQLDERWAVLTGGESQRKGGDIELSTARLLDLKHVTVYGMLDTGYRHDDAIAIKDHKNRIIIFGGFVVSKLKLPGLNGKSRALNVPTAVPGVERWELPQH
jgi:hypothetical protein